MIKDCHESLNSLAEVTVADKEQSPYQGQVKGSEQSYSCPVIIAEAIARWVMAECLLRKPCCDSVISLFNSKAAVSWP